MTSLPWSIPASPHLAGSTCFTQCRHRRRRRPGRDQASVSGIRWLGVPYISYAATKAAILQFTRVIALQYARSGIRANSTLPGMMNTPMVHAAEVIAAYGGSAEEMVRRRDEQCPMGRIGDAWDVAYAMRITLTEDAASAGCGIYAFSRFVVASGALPCCTRAQ